MILYHVISTYQLLNAMVHAAQREEKADLLVSNWIVDKFPAYQKLEGCFNKVTAYDATYDFWHKKPDTAKYIADMVGDLTQYDEVYIWAPQYTLGIYMAENNMPFIFGEDAAGLLTRPQILEDIVAKTDPKTFEYNKSLGLYNGEAKAITKWFCNAKAQTEGFEITDKVIDFDVVRELKALSEDKRREIIGFFVDIDKLPLEEGAMLLLTQHFSNLRVLNFDDHALIYQMVIDYFFPQHKLVIKPHPDDLMYYRKLFGDVSIIREKFPSEFIPFIFENQPAGVATISSTAIYNLRGHYPQVFELDTRYEKQFRLTHRYYMAVKLAQRMGKDIVCIGANELLLKRLCEAEGKDAPKLHIEKPRGKAPCLYLIDDVTAEGEEGRARVLDLMNNLPHGCCALFINSKEDYCWYSYEHKQMWNNIAALTLRKTAIKDKKNYFFCDLKDETVYLYSREKELLRMAKSAKIEKELPHVGVKVENASVMTPEQEKIKMLEGILAATEKRLLHYIEKEKNEK